MVVGKDVKLCGRLVGEVKVVPAGDRVRAVKLCLQDGECVSTVCATGAVMAAVAPGLIEGVRLHLEGWEIPYIAGDFPGPLVYVYHLQYDATGVE